MVNFPADMYDYLDQQEEEEYLHLQRLRLLRRRSLRLRLRQQHLMARAVSLLEESNDIMTVMALMDSQDEGNAIDE